MIRIDLRRLILWISLLSIMLVLAGGLHASYLVQRDLLLHNAQEDNRAYASKLAATTEYFLNDLRRYLAFSAEMLADMQAHPELMAEETRRQETQLGHFNSSFIVSPQGKVLSASASVPDLLGRQMHSTAAQDAIQTQRPTISEPFQGRSGRWLILYTHPIFGRQALHRLYRRHAVSAPGQRAGPPAGPALPPRRLGPARHGPQRHTDL